MRMGVTPEQVGAMTPWQFTHCMEQCQADQGWKVSGGSGDFMSAEKLKELGIDGF